VRESDRPEDDPADDAAPYWRHLGEHQLFVQQCCRCDMKRFPPMPGCPHCGHLDAEWVEVTHGGIVYSWVKVHRTANSAFAAEVPYVIATVELAPGCRIVGRLELEGPGVPRIGQAVTPTFFDRDGTTELRFRAEPAPANSQESNHHA
jgi:uncharacterized OB-fold protein